MTVADGFEASYEVVDAGDKIVKLTIKNNGSNLAGEQALVSMPIRAWELDNSNKKGATSNKEWTYAEFKASKEFWPVATEVRIQQGEVNYTDGAKDSFTGENVFVWSESWANYANMTKTQEGKDYYNAWNGGHTHDTELTVTKEAKAPTCTEDGWTAEYSCATCNSVVTWSETVPATGHDFELDLEQGKIVCKTCGEVNTAYTGLIEKDGTYYYAQLGVLSSGWKLIDGEWYYFHENTFNAATGNKKDYATGVRYDFADNGKLIHGEWVSDENGTRYYYGPSYYRASNTSTVSWAVIDGNTYGFDKDGYRYEGISFVREANAKIGVWYNFGDDGASQGIYTNEGLFDKDGETYYINADGTTATGLVKVGNDYYYFKSSTFAAVKSEHYWASVTNDLLPAGYYDFDEDGKIIFEKTDETLNGIVDGYYYVDGVKTYGGLMLIDGKYYYANSKGQIITDNSKYWISKTNDLLPAAFYNFGSDGAIIFEETDETLNGIVDGYYYVDGVKTHGGLMLIDGKYYYANSKGQVIKDNPKYWISKTNDLLPATFYNFGSDGAIIL